MADRIRREKDIIKSTVSNYLQTTTNSSYLSYFEGSPTYITYYQIDSTASLQDVGLETVNSLVGKNSPTKYKRILSVPVWGVDAIDVSNQLSERGLESSASGELLFLPNSIRPYPGDFFVFEYDGLEDHLFRINDVQYDKLTPEKYFRAQYSLYPNNAEDIFDNVSSEYECKYDPNGQIGSSTAIVNKVTEDLNNSAKELTDGLIDKYQTMYYDDDMDSFVYHGHDGGSPSGNEICYWSPYLQHFLHDTKALTKYNDEILTEVYINDINEVDNREIYSESAYRNSLFWKVITQDNHLDFDNNFLCVTNYELKNTRNLPFFMSPYKFQLVAPIEAEDNGVNKYLNAFPILFSNNKNGFKLFKDVDHYHKVHVLDEAHLTRIEPYLHDGDIVYECNKHELEPTAITLITDNNGNLNVTDASIETLIKPDVDTSTYEDLAMLNIIKSYLNDSLVLNDDLIKKLNDLYYKPSVATYVLMPIIIYILRKQITK